MVNPKQKYRSFTIRVPTDLYLKIANEAQNDGVYLNQKANQLIRLGLGEHISLDAALRAMLMEKVSQPEVVE